MIKITIEDMENNKTISFLAKEDARLLYLHLVMGNLLKKLIANLRLMRDTIQ